MKKNFKKSKFVILPALATLVLTGVASVTGTVAWFTANRAVNANIGPFVSTQVTSALNVTYTADDKSGTKAGKTNGIDVDGNLTHGSYDAKAQAEGNLYVARLNDSNDVTAYEDKGTASNHVDSAGGVSTNKWLAKAAVTEDPTSPAVWYGVSWKMKFTGASAEAGKTNYLLLDPSTTVFTDTITNGDTVKGLRIALMTGSKCLVIGGDSQMKHVTGTTSSNTASFDTGSFVDLTAGSSDKTAAKLEDNGAIDTSKYSFGALNADGIEITCVAWFEGEDSNIVSSFANGDSSTRSVVMSNVNTTLAFYSRTK